MKLPTMTITPPAESVHDTPEVKASRQRLFAARERMAAASQRAARLREILEPARYASARPPTMEEALDLRVHATEIPPAEAEAEQDLRAAQRAHEAAVEAARARVLAERATLREPLDAAITRHLEPLLAAIEAVARFDDTTEALTDRRVAPSPWGDLPNRAAHVREMRAARFLD